MIRILGLLGCALLAQPAVAEPPRWGGSVSIATDQLQRGVSRSSNDAALSAEVHAASTAGWFASLWAGTSRVRPSDSTAVELAATIGFSIPVADKWHLGGSFTHYESPWQRLPDFYRYDEISVDLRLRETWLLSASYSPNTSRFASAYGPVAHRDALAYELSYQRPIGREWRAHAGAGYSDLSDLFGDGYWYGSAGLGWARGHWQLQASYVVADPSAERLFYIGAGGHRALLELKYAF